MNEYDQAIGRIQRATRDIRACKRKAEDALLQILDDDIPDSIRPLVAELMALARDVREVSTTVTDLSKGHLDIEMPPRTNILAGSVKQLQSHLMHLTWQTQRIAGGDYDQNVDFLGDFSKAFNQMTAQLKERESKLNANNIIMASVYDHIGNLFIVSAENRSHAYIVNASARQTFSIPASAPDLSESMAKSSFLDQLLSSEYDSERQLELLDVQTGRWYHVVVSKLSWHGEDALLFYCTDMTVQKRREEVLEMDALTDALTGIGNRRRLDIEYERGWPLYRRLQVPVSAILIDIDHFKLYNDTYGHPQGDVCLMAVAGCIHKSISRSTDLLVRYGGEEFLALLPNTNSESAVAIAERMRANVAALSIQNEQGGEDTHVTCSFGVATCVPGTDNTMYALIQRADEALYEAKTSGRNRVFTAP